jgi:hypothetical protein
MIGVHLGFEVVIVVIGLDYNVGISIDVYGT